jgi:hypothetical protein
MGRVAECARRIEFGLLGGRVKDGVESLGTEDDGACSGASDQETVDHPMILPGFGSGVAGGLSLKY